MNRHVVLISRDYPETEIKISLGKSGDPGKPNIHIVMSLSDFMEALVKEVGNPTTIVTQAALLKRLNTAAQVVCTSMKAETNRLM